MPTITTIVRLPWHKRLRLLFGGRIYVQAIIDAEWFTRIRVRPGQAWLRGNGDTWMLRSDSYDVRADGYECRDVNGTSAQKEFGNGG